MTEDEWVRYLDTLSSQRRLQVKQLAQQNPSVEWRER